jgi:oxygen-independent coproporphyrinogen-3 oxidase
MDITNSHFQTLTEAMKRRADGFSEWAYFDHRVRSPEEARMALPYIRIPPEDVRQFLADALKKNEVLRQRAIYLHIPFCRQICRFCGYSRQLLTDTALADRYVQYLIAQIQRYGDTVWASAPPFEAVYFGGGTPTALSAHELARVIHALKRSFQLDKDCEITVESRFEGIGADDFRILSDAGVNRISFGIQSFDTEIRRNMGRIHEQDEILKCLELAKEGGFQNICADLIYNLPRQLPETWQEDLKLLAQSPVTGVSVYPLILFDRSLLSSQIRERTEPPLGDLKAEYDFYIHADRCLTETMKWQRFTPVQYGKPGEDQANYVRARGQGYEVLGLGAGAAGMIGDLIYVNSPNIADYIAAQKDGCDLPMMLLRLPQRYFKAQPWYRLSESDGINSRNLFEALPGMEQLIDQLTELHAVQQTGDKLTLTRAGQFWAGNISAMISELIGKNR